MQNDLIAVALMSITDHDPEYHFVDLQGRSPRFKIEQLDGDGHFAPSREAAEAFMAMHGMVPVTDEQMIMYRNQ